MIALAVVAFGVCLGCLVHAVYTDLKLRIIPRRDCYLIAACGSILQLLGGGVGAWLAGFSFGLMTLVFCILVKRAAGLLRGQSMELGGGDIRLMTAFSLASGPWAVWGALGAAVAVLVWACIGVLTSRLGLKDTFPMAPCLAFWPLTAIGISLL